MTTTEGTPDAIPAVPSGDSAPIQAENSELAARITGLLEQNAALISMVASMAAQLNWICQVISALSQSMPPFMRGAFNVPTPGAPQFPGQPGAPGYPG